jgi:hypothetical protein
MRLDLSRAYRAQGGAAWIYGRPDTWCWVRAYEVNIEAEPDMSAIANALGIPLDGEGGDGDARGLELADLIVTDSGRKAKARMVPWGMHAE